MAEIPAICTAEARPLTVPAVDDYAPDLATGLQRLGASVAEGLGASLSSSLGVRCGCASRGLCVNAGEPWAAPPDRVLFEAVQGQLDWRLVLPSAAADDLLATLLGYDQAEAGSGLSDTDRQLLQLPARSCALALARVLGRDEQAGPVRVLKAAETGWAPDGPLVEQVVALSLLGRQHELQLALPWRVVRPRCLPPPGIGGGVSPDALAGTPVTLEAVLTGPRLTAEELLGLRSGDVVKLGVAVPEAVLYAQGVPVAQGRAGAKGGHMAVSIRQVAALPEELSHEN